MVFDGATVLLTGGTGSFGKKFVEFALARLNPRVIRIYSRDEAKQYDMQRDPHYQDRRLRFFIGDVREQVRLQRAMEGADIVIHAPAMKQITVCELNPFEGIKTNVLGAQNVIESALNLQVPRVMGISTDKAVNPINLYGATKLCAEKMFIAANEYVGPKDVKISCVRYGNVIGSRGSAVPLFLSQRKVGRLTLTDERMTRFWISLDQAVAFVSDCIERMRGSEIFIPKIPSTSILDLVEAITPGSPPEVIGIRPGEKIHEVLLTGDEARGAVEFDDFFVVEPRSPEQSPRHWTDGKELPDGYCYSSDANPWRLTAEELRPMIQDIEAQLAGVDGGSSDPRVAGRA